MEQWLIEFNADYYKHQKPDFNSKEYGETTYQLYLRVTQCLNKKISDYEEAIKRTGEIFAEKRGVKLNVELPEVGLSKSISKQYVYGSTFRISEVLRKAVEPGLLLIGYDYYVYRTVSKPTGDFNRVFPRILTDIRGKFDPFELNRYPELVKFLHVKESNTNGYRRYELYEEDDLDGISFEPIFSNATTKLNSLKKDKRKAQEELPKEFSIEDKPPQ